MEKLIEIKHVSAAYGKKTVLRNVSLDIFRNDFLGIIGPNGGGKTTLLKVILGLLPASSGGITFFKEGQEVPSLKIGYLPQIDHPFSRCNTLGHIDKLLPAEVARIGNIHLAAFRVPALGSH